MNDFNAFRCSPGNICCMFSYMTHWDSSLTSMLLFFTVWEKIIIIIFIVLQCLHAMFCVWGWNACLFLFHRDIFTHLRYVFTLVFLSNLLLSFVVLSCFLSQIQGSIDFIKSVTVTVSLVTKDLPHRPHPHCLVGKDCPNGSGICVVTFNPRNNRRHRCTSSSPLSKTLTSWPFAVHLHFFFFFFCSD